MYCFTRSAWVYTLAVTIPMDSTSGKYVCAIVLLIV